MDFSTIKAPTLKDRFVEEIETVIISGKMEVGEAFPPDRELASQMGVSITVVHAGMGELERCGFVNIRPRQGAVVANYRKYGNLETMRAILNYVGNYVDSERVQAQMKVALVTQVTGTVRAIDNATEEQMDQLGVILEEFAAASDPEELAKKGFAFWHELAYLSGNLLLSMISYSLQDSITTTWKQCCEQYGGHLIEDAKTYYALLRAKDREKALEFSELIIKNMFEREQIAPGTRLLHEEAE